MASPVERFLENHGPLFVINLAERRDRRAEFGKQLNKIGVSYEHPKVTIFPAIRPTELAGFPTLGARGCFLSHIGVLEAILSMKANTVIVCEDDLDFASDFVTRLPSVLDVLEREDWDLFYAGYTSGKVGTLVDEEANILELPPTHPVTCSHFYLLRGPAIADFRAYLSLILTRPVGHPEGGPMHFDGAINHFRRDRLDLTTFAALPTLGTQRSSRTDVHSLRWFDRTALLRDAVQVLRKLKNH